MINDSFNQFTFATINDEEYQNIFLVKKNISRYIYMEGWDDKPLGWEQVIMKYDSAKYDLQPINIYSNTDAIFVLAGGVDNYGLCHEWVKRRLRLAYQIYKSIEKPIFCLGGGSYHKEPILNKNKFVVHESSSCSEYLIQLGVDSKRIYKEWSSYDTIANAFFSFVNFIIPLKLNKIVLITSEFHMARSKEIFLWLKNIFNSTVDFNFVTVSDENIDKELIETRIEREHKSLIMLKKKVIEKINDIDTFHKWFYTEHKAYCSNSEVLRNCEVSAKVKKSY
jgi:hypothetical protein